MKEELEGDEGGNLKEDDDDDDDDDEYGGGELGCGCLATAVRLAGGVGAATMGERGRRDRVRRGSELRVRERNLLERRR